MTWEIIINLAVALGALAFMFFFVRWAKRSNRREGWDAFHNGLSYNSAWGKDICEGWQAASMGFPRP